MPASSSGSEPPAGARVRDATEADLPRLVELLAQLSTDTPREELGPPLPERYRAAFRAIETAPGQRVFVVEAQGRVVGSAMLVIAPNLTHQGRPFALVENVVVDATERSSGYGELLMHHALDAARAAGCYKLVLTSNKLRKDAHRFYKRLGMEATSEGFRIDF
jgi:GNAT superfamily N-acetyltransferase